MRAVDPRLMRYARSTRGFLLLTIIIGAGTAALVIAQARLLSGIIVDLTANGLHISDVSTAVLLLALVFAVRAGLGWLSEVAAVRTSARAKQELREASLRHVLDLGPAGPGMTAPGETSALITRGVDALDSYYSRYLPQLILAVIVPIAVLLTVLGQDLISTLIIAVTIPLIPVFMILIGMYTKSRVDRQWRTMAVLSGHFLDLVSGLATLKAFGRARTQVDAIRAIGERYRSSTMGVLRISFLSSLALELLATLSVALVAVSVGLRLAEGQIQYSVALFVLVLAPEAYLPLRLVGQHFHAAAEGLGAADRIFTILETPVSTGGDREVPTGRVTLRIEGLEVSYEGRGGSALGPCTFTCTPGTVTAIVGRSGGGKSTLLSAILGFVEPTSGSIAANDVTLTQTDHAAWRRRVAWLPQRAQLVDRNLSSRPTVADALRLAKPDATDDELWQALQMAGLAEEIRALPAGLDSRIATDGGDLSVGQRQRIALARVMLGDADVVLLDEPTAALDIETESAVLIAIVELARAGATVLVVAHRPAMIEIADQIVRIDAALAQTQGVPA